MINQDNLEQVPGSGISAPEVGKEATRYLLGQIQSEQGREATERLLNELRAQKKKNGTIKSHNERSIPMSDRTKEELEQKMVEAIYTGDADEVERIYNMSPKLFSCDKKLSVNYPELPASFTADPVSFTLYMNWRRVYNGQPQNKSFAMDKKIIDFWIKTFDINHVADKVQEHSYMAEPLLGGAIEKYHFDVNANMDAYVKAMKNRFEHYKGVVSAFNGVLDETALNSTEPNAAQVAAEACKEVASKALDFMAHNPTAPVRPVRPKKKTKNEER